MTRGEAISAMKEGKRVAHKYFSSNEYLYMDKGRIYSEDGVCWGTPSTCYEGCLNPAEPMFLTGWSIIEKLVPPVFPLTGRIG